MTTSISNAWTINGNGFGFEHMSTAGVRNESETIFGVP